MNGLTLMNRLHIALWSLLAPFCLLPDWPSFSCCVVVVEVTAAVAEFPLTVIRRFVVVRPSSLCGAVTEWTWEEILACFFFAVTEDFATFDPPSSAGVESLELSVTCKTFFNGLSFAISSRTGWRRRGFALARGFAIRSSVATLCQQPQRYNCASKLPPWSS